MDFAAWHPTYQQILADFGWSEDQDRASAEALQSVLPHGAWRHVGTELKHRARAIIVGCDDRLGSLQASDLPPGIVVAADGATQRLQEIGVIPRVVVTDLDGDPEALAWAAAAGASIVVHAHGDNQDQLARVSGLGPLVAGTCQCDPAGLQPVRNLGGFTDGDRAVLLCESFGVKEIVLACCDTTRAPSEYSHRFDPEVKARKLSWAGQIIDGARERGVPIRAL